MTSDYLYAMKAHRDLKGCGMFRSLLLPALCLSLIGCGVAEQPKKDDAETAVKTDVEKPTADTLFKVEDAYILVPLVGSTQTAGFLKITALTDAPASIVSVSSPKAAEAELHTHSMAGGVMSMKKVDYIDLPISGTAELRPNGDHIMLFGLTEGLEIGDTVSLELVVLSSGEAVVLTVDAVVKPLI